MRWGLPRLVLVGLAIAVVASVGVAAATSSASLGVYNPAWDGASEFSAMASAQDVGERVLEDAATYADLTGRGTLAVVLSPDERYDAAAAERVRAFARRGGTVLVATDFRSPGPALLAGLGTNATVTGLPLRDEQRYGPTPAFPRATNVTEHPLTDGVDELVLNHPSSVDPRGASVLVASSPFGYLDANRNGELDDEETLARYPVVTREPLGDGAVVVVSDPSVFINAMLDRADNRPFLATLVGSHDRVVVDVSHTSALPPLVSLRLLLRGVPLVQLLAGLALLGAVAATGRRWQPAEGRNLVDVLPDRWVTLSAKLPGLGAWGGMAGEAGPQVPVSSEHVAAAVRERHPEWDEARVERVTEGIIRRRRQ